MSLTSLNFTSLAAGAVAPVSGQNYHLENVKYAHWLDNAQPQIPNGNPVLAWSQNIPESSNQIWKFLTYPSGNDKATVFTLQDLATLQSNSSTVIDGRGGYIRADPTTNKVVHGGQPQAWKLIQVAPSVYKMSPFENVFSENGTLVATDVNPNIQSISQNQLHLLKDNSSVEQFWVFRGV